MATAQDLAALEAQIATGIGQQETGGGVAGVGASLNNPGALKWSQWQAEQFGAIQAPSGFAKFPSLEQGKAAMLALVNKYVNAGNSISTLINAWAPPSDNNTNNEARIAQLAQQTGLDPQQPIKAQAAPGSSGSSGGGIIDWGGTWGDIKGLITGQGSGSVYGRLAAFVCGLIFLTVGLVMLSGKGKVIVQEVGKGIREGAAGAAVIP